MNFPDRGREIIQALYEANRGLASGTDDQQRLLTRLIGEQFAFEFGPSWGCKAASASRPQGPSELAFCGPPLLIWRWSDGDGHVTGTPGAPLPAPLLIPVAQSAGQFFIAVEPIDHLKVSAPPAPDPSQPPPTPDLPPAYLSVLNAILDRLHTLDVELAALHHEHLVLSQQVYRTSLFGVSIVLKPGPP